MKTAAVTAETHPDQFKIHETVEDRQRQREILRAFAHRYNLTGKLTNTLSRLDARLFKNGVYFAVAEAKYRNNAYDKYPNYTIDVEKIESLLQRAKEDGVVAILVVSWEGDVRYINLTKVVENWDGEDLLFPISVQQRHDRQELADRVYHIPLNLFKKVINEN